MLDVLFVRVTMLMDRIHIVVLDIMMPIVMVLIIFWFSVTHIKITISMLDIMMSVVKVLVILRFSVL